MSRISRVGAIAAAITGAFVLTYLAFAPGSNDQRVTGPALGPGDAGAQTSTPPRTLDEATPASVTEPTGTTTATATAMSARPSSAVSPTVDLEPQPGVNHLAAGRQLFWKRDYETARVELRRAIRQRPGTYDPHYLLGLCEQRLGNFESAEREYIAAREIDGDRPEALVNLARVYLELETPTEAMDVIEHAAAVAPQRDAVWNVRGRVHLALGHREQAIAAFEEACRLDTTNAYAWNNLGYARLLGGEHLLAVEPLERAVALRDDIAYMQNNLGAALEGAGRIGAAHLAFATAARIDPDHPSAAASAARLEPLLARLEAAEVVARSGGQEIDERSPVTVGARRAAVAATP